MSARMADRQAEPAAAWSGGVPASSDRTHPVDPCVAARERGAFAGAQPAPRTATAEPGRPQLPRGPPPFGAYSIPEFCRAHSIRESFFSS